MKVKKLIEVLKTCNQSDKVKFYFLENNILHGCNYETILNVDNQVEITITKEKIK